MQEIIKQLTSLSWWISVVVVGVLASLAAAYLKPRTDRVIGSVSGRYRRRNGQRARARAGQIEALRSDRHEQIMFAISINYRYLSAIKYALSGVTIMILISIALPLSSAIHNLIISYFIILTLGYSVLLIIMSSLDFRGVISDREIISEDRKSQTSESKATLGSVSNESPVGTSRNIKQEKE
jgi:hypothetical protein